MKINLADLYKNKETLKYIQSVLRNELVTKGLARKIDAVVNLFEDIEKDLEISGESILELDKPRLEAIEERNKVSHFIKNADDL